MYGPFIPLQSGDLGVRSIESIQFSASMGGIGALVLCKPIATMTLKNSSATNEKDFLLDEGKLPAIQDGAVLNFLVHPNNNYAAAITQGMIEFIFN
jgi:hypothetical protein